MIFEVFSCLRNEFSLIFPAWKWVTSKVRKNLSCQGWDWTRASRGTGQKSFKIIIFGKTNFTPLAFLPVEKRNNFFLTFLISVMKGETRTIGQKISTCTIYSTHVSIMPFLKGNQIPNSRPLLLYKCSKTSKTNFLDFLLRTECAI